MSNKVQPQEHEKSCLCCRYLDLDFGSADHSEMTPGDAPELNCEKGHFLYVYPQDENESIEDILDTAKRCEDFEHR